MILRRLNVAGIAFFRDELEQVRRGRAVQGPLPWLQDESLTEIVDENVRVTASIFTTRLTLARHIVEQIGRENIDRLMNDTGVWAWLAAVYFDSVCPPTQSGIRAPKSDYRYIPSSSYTHYYRHLIRGPVRILRLHETVDGVAEVVLTQPPHKPGDLVEQLSSRLEVITNSAILATANTLYYDRTKRALKPGTSSKSQPGRPRRFVDYLGQLELTRDLYSIGRDELLALLPREFERWRS